MRFIKRVVLGNFFGFLFTISAVVCLLLGIVFFFNSALLTNTSSLPTYSFFFMGAVFYFALAVIIALVKK